MQNGSRICSAHSTIIQRRKMLENKRHTRELMHAPVIACIQPLKKGISFSMHGILTRMSMRLMLVVAGRSNATSYVVRWVLVILWAGQKEATTTNNTPSVPAAMSPESPTCSCRRQLG